MRIKKTYNGVVPNTKLLNAYSESKNDGYSCDYINNIFTDLQYTTEGLTTSNCVINNGGYYRIGNIIIVNMRINPTVTGLNSFVSGLPKASVNGTTLAIGNTTDGTGTAYFASVSGSGVLRANIPTANKNYSIGGIYICLPES